MYAVIKPCYKLNAHKTHTPFLSFANRRPLVLTEYDPCKSSGVSFGDLEKPVSSLYCGDLVAFRKASEQLGDLVAFRKASEQLVLCGAKLAHL